MHAVIATSLVPTEAPQSGYEMANAAIAAAFVRAGARVTHLGFTWPDRPPADPDNTVLLGSVNVKTADATMARKLQWLAGAMGAGIPFVSAKLRIIDRGAVQAALDDAAPDVVVVNGTALAGAFEPELTARPYIFIAHNVEHESAREAAHHAGGLIEAAMYRREARLLKALEGRLIKGARHVLTLTAEDRATFGLDGSGRADVLPLVTPQADAPPGPRVPVFDVGLIGTWTWAPNRVGLEWFLQEVMPLLPPQASVAVAGGLPGGFPQRDRRVKFLGRVIDARQFQRQCRVMALAARAGTGVQLKTIEALELGLPAVATTASLRGLMFLPDNLKVADTPRQFAEALAGQIVGHRTNTVTDADGSGFRARQIAGMDAAVGAALAPFHSPNSGQSDPKA